MTFKTSKAWPAIRPGAIKRSLSGRYVKDGNCPFCGALFHTRLRAMHHVVFGSKACKARLLSSPGLPELTEDEIASARQQDRLDYAAAKARGVWRNAGPPVLGRLDKAENTTPLETFRYMSTCLSPAVPAP